MLQFSRNRIDQPAAQAFNIRSDFLVVQDRQLGAHFARRVLS
jgi:hypothetical protein